MAGARLFSHPAVRTLLTLSIALLGGLAAQALHLPAGLLMGGAVAVAIAAIAGLRTHVPNRLRDTAFVVVGMTLGTNVSHDALSLVPQWPLSLLGLALELALIVGLGTLTLRFVFGYDRATAYLSSFPGHLSFVLGISEAGYGDSGKIAIIQSTRVLMLTVLVPLVARFDTARDLSIVPQGAQMGFWALIALIVASTAGGFAFRLMHIPAAFVLGSMAVATAGKLMGLYDGRLPLALTLAGYVVMGSLIGSRFAGATPSALRRAALGGIAVTAISVLVVSLVAFGLAALTPMPFGQLWLGLAPGALEAMGALGVALGFDTAFIAAHHTARFFLLTLAIPSVAALVGKREEPCQS